ncbi:hypothetical protein Ancab_028229 [Ancistrocladus abbreviatus]
MTKCQLLKLSVAIPAAAEFCAHPWTRSSRTLCGGSTPTALLPANLPSTSSKPPPTSLPPDFTSPIPSLLRSDAEVSLTPLLIAIDTGSPKVIEPALDCRSKLFSLNLISTEIYRSDANDNINGPIVSRIVDSVSKLCSLGEAEIELAMFSVLLSAVRSPCVLIRGEYLIHIVKTCYNVYLGGLNGTNQICAKAVLAQIMLNVFKRVEVDTKVFTLKIVSVGELLECTDRNLSEGNSALFVQGLINEVVEASSEVKQDVQLWLSKLPSGDALVEERDDKKGGEVGDHDDEMNV